jgi:hypothetical protein
MNALSMIDLAQAREVMAELLDEIGLEAYLFEIEPKNTHWELKLECAMEAQEGWENIKITVPGDILPSSRHNRAARERLLGLLRDKLAECKLREPQRFGRSRPDST